MDVNIEMCQTRFILNALKDGWSVKMNNKGELEFTKEKEDDMKENNYSKKFLEKYGTIDLV
jgi:hypothetical protein